MSLLLAVTQAITSMAPERIDLTVRTPCEIEQQSKDEIVVCAERESQESFRINQPQPKRAKPLRAEAQLAEGVGVSAETESANVGGFPSNRLMVRLKFKF